MGAPHHDEISCSHRVLFFFFVVEGVKPLLRLPRDHPPKRTFLIPLFAVLFFCLIAKVDTLSIVELTQHGPHSTNKMPHSARTTMVQLIALWTIIAVDSIDHADVKNGVVVVARDSHLGSPVLRLTFADFPRATSLPPPPSIVRCWGRYCGRKGRGFEQAAVLKRNRAARRTTNNHIATALKNAAAPPLSSAPSWCELWESRSAAQAFIALQNDTSTMHMVADATWVPWVAPVEWQRRVYYRHPQHRGTGVQGAEVHEENCMKTWSQMMVRGSVDAGAMRDGRTTGDEDSDAASSPDPPKWWQARHQNSHRRSLSSRNANTAPSSTPRSSSKERDEDHLYVDGGWWACYLPSLLPSVPLDLFPRHLELRCGLGLDHRAGDGVSVDISSNLAHLPCLNATMAAAADLSCEVVYGLTQHDPSRYFQEGGGSDTHNLQLPMPPQLWGTSPTVLRWLTGFLFAIALMFFLSMVYLIASPSYHRKLVSYRLAKKFDELEDWVAKKEEALHHGAEHVDQHPHQSAAGTREEQQDRGVRRRAQRLAARGFIDPSADLQEKELLAAAGSINSSGFKAASPGRHQRQQHTFSKSAVLYQNPAKRTLGELLEDSRRDKGGYQRTSHQHEHAAMGTPSDGLSQQDRQHWDHTSRGGRRQTDHQHRHASTTVSPVVSAAQVESFPIDGLLID
jgi:hypothetical protein